MTIVTATLHNIEETVQIQGKSSFVVIGFLKVSMKTDTKS